MKKYIKWIVLGAIVIVIGLTFLGNYNSLVNKEETVSQSQADIQTQLQKRADKIPNLVSTVKGYADYESDTYKAVTEARAAAGAAQTVGEIGEADDRLNSALNVWVNAVTENYPDLKADKSFTALMDEISSMENEIQYARTKYNEKATAYNKSVRRFPGNIFASMFGFEKVELFKASDAAQNAPMVSFD